MSQHRSTRRQHVHRSAEEKAALLAEWARSGLSAQAFERQRELTKCSLWRWTREAERSAVAAVPAKQSAISFAPVHVTKVQATAVMEPERVIAEVLVGRDVRVRVLGGADMDQVSRLVRALSGGASC
jgi:hypothetical protein